MKPSIGRIVHYRTKVDGETLPLLITHVHSDVVVSGVAFSAFTHPDNNHADRTSAVPSVEFDGTGKAAQSWRWPPEYQEHRKQEIQP